MSKFTPGEWDAVGSRVKVNGHTLAVVNGVENARLMAAAPDMYDALKELICLDKCTDCSCLDRAQAVEDARDLLAQFDSEEPQRKIEELNPCPFCGSKEVYKHDIALYNTYGEGYVLCPSCKAQVNFMIPRTADIETRDDVLFRLVDLWNRRATNE